MGVGSEADVSAVLAIELRHEGLVGVADEQDGRVEGLDLLLAALVRLDADGPPAAPVIPLTFEPFPQPGRGPGDTGVSWGRQEACPTLPGATPGILRHSLVHSFSHLHV